jgi:hypothetical protein
MRKNIFIPDFEKPIRIPARVKIEIAQPPVAIAGTKITLRLKFSISKDIEPEEILKLQIFGGRNNKGYFPNIQIDDPEKDGFILVKCNNVQLKTSQGNNPFGVITIFPPGNGIKAGKNIYVIMKNVAVGTTRFLNKFFVLYRDNPKSPEYPHKAESVWNRENQKNILAACVMHILGGKVHHIKTFGPSGVFPEKKFYLLIRPEDKFHNLSSKIPDKKIKVLCGKTELKKQIKITKNSTCQQLKISLKNPGVYRITVKYGSQKFISNPIICSEKKRFNLYWGMIHAHTEMSDGAGTIDYYFHQLKNEAGLDFGASGDHDHLWETTDKMWRKTCNSVRKWNHEKRFITFPGYEWAKWRRNGDGDRNVYYYHDNRPMYRSDEGCYPNPQALFAALKDEKAIIVPHHTAHGGNFCDWKDHNLQKESLIEIYQERGSYECSEKDGNPVPECKNGWEPFKKGYVINALLAGWRAGFTGGGDDHISHAGTDFPRGNCNYKDGLIGVFAKTLTRKGIWEALWNRRTIATTGARIFLYYTVNDKPLGSEIYGWEASTRRIHIIFHGTDNLDRIEIIRNGRIIYVSKEEGIDTEFLWEDCDPVQKILLPPTKFSKEPFAFYYIRAVQKNKDVVWASPVWILGS